MTNQLTLVGTVIGNFKNGHIEGEDCKQFKLSCHRPIKNEDGVYPEDIVPVLAFGVLADNLVDYINSGDVVGVVGYVCSVGKSLYIRADKVSVLSSKKKSVAPDEEE